MSKSKANHSHSIDMGSRSVSSNDEHPSFFQKLISQKYYAVFLLAFIVLLLFVFYVLFVFEVPVYIL
ncbi:hypothetical protein XU18_2418 [Perkinsela sp. CCAP 1560/4]|nr:hypothetical protein XU18_2418 [Perkinsela sp. CCAP 1560/4]|eukprot:KNH06816.1 hypothetical protein XU18_2418 [Perkinsela sp. CCAP 1560/4]